MKRLQEASAPIRGLFLSDFVFGGLQLNKNGDKLKLCPWFVIIGNYQPPIILIFRFFASCMQNHRPKESSNCYEMFYFISSFCSTNKTQEVSIHTANANTGFHTSHCNFSGLDLWLTTLTFML